MFKKASRKSIKNKITLKDFFRQQRKTVYFNLKEMQLTQIKAWLSSQDGIGGGSMCFARGRIKDRYIEEDHRRRMA